MSLIIATINVRGFGSLIKKNYLRNFLDDHRIDVACLQEITNSSDKLTDSDYKYIMSRGSSGLSTAIVIKNHLKPKEVQKDLNGLIIKLIFKNYSIININGYSYKRENNFEKRSRLFTKYVQKYIQNNENTILLGDFNTVTEKVQPGKFSSFLRDLINCLNIKDSPNI